MPKANMEKEQLAAHMKQVHGRASSASLGRDADAWRGHWEQTAQQDPAKPSVCIEYSLSSTSGEHKKKETVVKQVIVSFKRKPPEELCRSCLSHTTRSEAPSRRASLLQQQDGLEDRELQQPENEGQCFSRRQSGGLYGRPGQVSAKDGMRQPKTGRDRSMSFPWTTREQPQVVYVKFMTGTMSKQEVLERLEARTSTSEPVALAEEEEQEDGVDKKLSQEQKWEDAISRQLNLKLSTSEATAAETPAGHTYRSPSLAVIDALAHERRTDFQRAPRALHRASTAMESRRSSRGGLSPEEQEKQHARHCTPALLVTAQYITGEVVHKAVTVIQEPSEQTEEQQDLEDSVDVSLATPAGAENQTPAPDSPTDDALLDTAQYIKSAVVRKAVIVTQGPEEQIEEQQDLEQSTDEVTKATATTEGTESPADAPDSPTDDAPVLLDTDEYNRTKVLGKGVIATQGTKQQPEELRDLEQSTDEVTRATATAAGAEMPRHIPRTASHGPADDAPVLLDTAQYIRTEVVRKAVIMTQAPVLQLEEQWNREGSMDEVMAATATTAEVAGSPAYTLNCPTPDAPTLLDTFQYIRSEVQGKATLLVQSPEQQPEEQENLEQGMDEVVRATATAAGAESPAHALHSLTDNAPGLPDTDEYNRTKVLGKAVIVIQGTNQQPEELKDLKQSPGEVMRATATAAETEVLAHTLHSPAGDAPPLLDTAQDIKGQVLGKAALNSSLKSSKQRPKVQQNPEKGTDNMVRATTTAARTAPTARRTAGPPERKYGRGTGRTNLISRAREPSKRLPKPHS
ncbi:uncharacterized protein LOC113981864 isoform X1 [Neopelma chrysocephalum]|uniref:uncharacterized protein LOC113981864 isoform X1 n=1 Tax=Neopelma chrysocephalum TaxID=114329 RepID=UPI000FCD3B74|nr:uncharacterized protein LOC113981864 isoform X1 [Neopelma chrysocephalum]